MLLHNFFRGEFIWTTLIQTPCKDYTSSNKINIKGHIFIKYISYKITYFTFLSVNSFIFLLRVYSKLNVFGIFTGCSTSLFSIDWSTCSVIKSGFVRSVKFSFPASSLPISVN